ncbi:MAG: VWA domain-containing protein [Chitinivibrionia bacterium]|nr:VWA domain-containing protein [Chitinivibrionia bacterium]
MKKIIVVILTILTFFATIFGVELRVNPKHKEWTQNAETYPIMLTVYPENTQQQNNVEPLQVLYLIDVSESFVGNVRQETINGGIELVKRLSDADYFGIILYGEYSRTLLPLSAIGFTGRERINTLLSEIGTERRRDPLAALDRVVSEFSQNKGRRSDGKNLVMSVLGSTYEDGEGNSYEKKFTSAMNELGVQVYTIGHGDDFDENAAIMLSEKTGGRAYFAGKDRADLLKNKFEMMFAHITNPVHTKNVDIEFTVRDGIKITNFQDSILSKNFIPKLVLGDTVNLFFELKNRPKRNSDVDIDFDYENIIMRSNLSGTASLKINLSRGNSSDFAEKSEKIIKYQLFYNMAQSIDELKIGDKKFRKDYADGFRRMLETRLGLIRNEINSREIQTFFTEMVALYDMINGGTASNEFIIKTVKYNLHYCKFPE